MRLYRRFVPERPADRIDAQNGEAFAGIMVGVERLADAMRGGTAGRDTPSVLRRSVESGSGDRTALGDLVYMFEPAHFDVYSLWH